MSGRHMAFATPKQTHSAYRTDQALAQFDCSRQDPCDFGGATRLVITGHKPGRSTRADATSGDSLSMRPLYINHQVLCN